MTAKEMAGGEVAYGGWLPVNSESNNPSLTLVNNPPITEPLTQDLDFPYFEEQQEEIRPTSPWQESNAVLERQHEEIKTTSYRMSVAPWDCFKGFECALKVLKILHTYITTDTLTD